MLIWKHKETAMTRVSKGKFCNTAIYRELCCNGPARCLVAIFSVHVSPFFIWSGMESQGADQLKQRPGEITPFLITGGIHWMEHGTIPLSLRLIELNQLDFTLIREVVQNFAWEIVWLGNNSCNRLMAMRQFGPMPSLGLPWEDRTVVLWKNIKGTIDKLERGVSTGSWVKRFDAPLFHFG